ncbi:MAG: c-type cytochrome [Acidobacteriota bacterium]
MQRLVTLIAPSFILSIIVLTAITSSNQDAIITGKDIYRLNCAGCHGADRTGNPPYYPSLLNIEEKLSKREIQEIIDKGKGKMPAFFHLTPQEKTAIIAFLLDEKPQSVAISTTGLGERIFKSNCASCHRASTNDPKPPNVWMMEPAPLAGATKRFAKEEFFRILETGICYMPSFDHFTSSEREALYAFVESLEGKGEPARPTMGEMCPMMMRMRKGK